MSNRALWGKTAVTSESRDKVTQPAQTGPSRFQKQMRDVVDVSFKVPTGLREQIYDAADLAGVRPNVFMSMALALGSRALAKQFGIELAPVDEHSQGAGAAGDL